MPLINQYFKNHCLYFLSTPAKVLGSGGHSSNKEKEMIARWSPLLYKCNTQRDVMIYILFMYHFPPFISISFLLHFPFLPFSLLLIIVSSVKCPLWWDTEFLSLVRFQLLSESLPSFLCERVQLLCCNLNSTEDILTAELYLYVQGRMLQQLLTVFTFWHGHWMQGFFFFPFNHMMCSIIKIWYLFVLVFYYNLSLLK